MLEMIIQFIERLGIPAAICGVFIFSWIKVLNWLLIELSSKWQEVHDMGIKTLENITILTNKLIELANKIIERMDSMNDRISELERHNR